MGLTFISKFVFVLGIFLFINLGCGNKDSVKVKDPNADIKFDKEFLLDSTRVYVNILSENLATPWEITWGPDNFLWITDYNMTVARVNPLTGDVSPIMVNDSIHFTHSNSSIYHMPMGLVHHPQFKSQPFVFVSFMDIVEDQNEYTGYLSLKRYRYSAESNLLSEPLLILDNISTEASRNPGGRMCIDRTDKLILCTGDQYGHANYAQNINSLSGKMLRINLDGTIPEDNPFPKSYVYTYGHRNPQGVVLATNGKLYSSEHGPSDNDEVNIIEKGRNYGWPLVGGLCDTEAEQAICDTLNVYESIKFWTPPIAPSSIIYYDNLAILPWRNSLIVSTLKESDLRVLKLDKKGEKIISESVVLNNQFGRIRDMCVSPDGDLFLITLNEVFMEATFVRPVKDQEINYDAIVRISSNRIDTNKDRE